MNDRSCVMKDSVCALAQHMPGTVYKAMKEIGVTHVADAFDTANVMQNAWASRAKKVYSTRPRSRRVNVVQCQSVVGTRCSIKYRILDVSGHQTCRSPSPLPLRST